jgi:alkylated DNA repair protein (DNA oxidative demethylase)
MMQFLDDLLPVKHEIVRDAYLLAGFALEHEALIRGDLGLVLAEAPFRHMVTPGGFTMSVAMTNCGLGWVTDKKGYRYTTHDPINDQPWPAIPDSFKKLAKAAAAEAGFIGFEPDACLINRYNIGARMSLHQDKNEQDLSQPVVSVSLGLPAIFQFGGFERADKTIKITLNHGDVVVWGGEARLRYHGVLPLKTNYHPAFGDYRINMTFRKAA